MHSGLFIVIEGIDGSGKTTTVNEMAKYIESCGRSVFRMQGIGGTGVAETLREILTNESEEVLDPNSKFLLFAAAKGQIAPVIRTLLDKGVVVICDRFTDSTLVYQRLDGVDKAFIESVHNELKLPMPHLTILMDISAKRAIKRLQHRYLNALDILDVEYLNEARAMYRAIARTSSTHVIIDAEKESLGNLSDEIKTALDKILE